MARPAYLMVLDSYIDVHYRILEFADEMSEEQIQCQLAPDALPVAFFLWHLGRWADHLQAAIPGMTPALSERLPAGQQVWDTQALAEAWGFTAERMGYSQTGMDMDESAAAKLAFPPKEQLLRYVREAFAAAERAVRAIDEAQFNTLEEPQPLTEGIFSPGGTVGEAVFSHLLHDMLHFGMIQNLKGLVERREESEK